MKRKISLAVTLALVMLLGVLSLAACGESLQLANPENVKYDGSTITWKAVENADKYTVCIDDGEEKTVTNPKFSYNAGGKEFSVTITARSDNSKIACSPARRP